MKVQLSSVVLLTLLLSQSAAVAQSHSHRRDGISFCERWHEVMKAHEELSLTHSPDHPDVVSLKKRIALLMAAAKERDPAATPDNVCARPEKRDGE